MPLIDARRNALTTVPLARSTHAGLWLDKYMAGMMQGGGAPPGGREPKQELLREVARIELPALYGQFFARWQATLGELGARTKVARALGRIAIGMGNESVLETAITLHRTYGVPYLPGSALKGLAAAFARQRLGEAWKASSDAYRIVFGDTANAGYVRFFDAYPLTGEGHLVEPDIMAIHHPDYYQQGKVPPADWDDPSLVPFPTATGRYLLALAGPTAWVDAVFQMLGFALRDVGIGAKTSSGYGRMVVGEAGSADGAQRASRQGGTVERPGNQASVTPTEPYGVARRRLLAERPPEGRRRGVVTTVVVRPNDETFGIITPTGGGGELHVKQAWLRPAGLLRKDQVVEFSTQPAAPGQKRPAATGVVVLREPDL